MLASTSSPAAAWTSRSANWRSSGSSIDRPSMPLLSRIHRARSTAVLLLPSANPWLLVTRYARMAAAFRGSEISLIDRSAASARSSSSGSSNHSSDVRTRLLISTASRRLGLFNARGDTRGVLDTHRDERSARRGRRVRDPGLLRGLWLRSHREAYRLPETQSMFQTLKPSAVEAGRAVRVFDADVGDP